MSMAKRGSKDDWPSMELRAEVCGVAKVTVVASSDQAQENRSAGDASITCTKERQTKAMRRSNAKG